VAVCKSIMLYRVRRRIAGGQTNVFPIDGEKVSAQVSTFVHVKDRLKMAICETVEVDDDGELFGRQRINYMEHIL